MDPRTRVRTSHSATGTEFGGRTEDGFGVGAEVLVGGNENTGTAGGRAERARALNAESDRMSKGGESLAAGNDERTEMPTPQQKQTPRGSQFKAPPRFRFGSSQAKPSNGSPPGAKASNNAPAHATQPRWRATQTPLRQSLRREVTEEEIVDGEEGEMLLEDGRESVERRNVDVDVDVEREEYEDITYSQLDAETPVAKRRKVDGDPVQSVSHSQSEHDGAPSYVQSQADRNSFPQADRFERDYGDQNDEEILYNDGREQHPDPQLLPEHSHSILSTHPQPATAAPPSSHRPRFILPSSHPPHSSTPQPPSQSTFARTPHFFIQTPTHPHLDDEPQFIKPPKFVHIEEPEPMQPLPEEFSPRKKGQKFVVGGVAGEVRGWLIDLEHHGSGMKETKGKDGEQWMVKMVVDEVKAGRGVGWTIAKGDGMNVILGGEGIREGLERGKEVVKGSVVGIKAPVWEVEVEGVRWGVGANWRTWER